MPTTFSFPRPIPIVLIGVLLVPVAVLSGCAGTSSDPGPRTVQPGAPGEPARMAASGGEAAPSLGYTEADVRFVRNMIVHHAQALVMTDLVLERTERADIRRLSRRIQLSQTSEIARMERWLLERGETGPDEDSHASQQPSGEPGMAGMLTRQQMDSLRDAEREDFERRFLELMIQHHEGALSMVDALMSTPGAAQDTEVFQLASHVEADQASEITRMRAMRAVLE